MTKVDRVEVADGDKHAIHCAVLQDLTSPASDFLDRLAEGMWEPDPDASDLPDDAQLKDRDKLLGFFELVAEDGLPPYGGAINVLEEGVWEFKIGKKRVSYYDTPGDGTFSPKLKISDRRTSPDADDLEFWWYPRMDEYLRLGHCFPKTGQQTRDSDIKRCIEVREEDLSHDQTD